MDELIAFLQARLNEFEASSNEVHLPRNCGSIDHDGDFSPEPIWCSCGYPSRVLREVTAMRSIVLRCSALVNEMDAHPSCLVSPRALLARQILLDLASIWNNHAAYREDWALWHRDS